MKNFFLGLTSLLLLCACAHNTDNATSHSLLPLPQQIGTSKGSFTVGEGTKLYIAADSDDRNAIANALAAWSGVLEVTGENTTANCIAMEVCDNVANVTSPEGYTINVTKEKINVKATSAAGLFYAAQTLLQLADGSNTIPACKITDEPQFAYRGLMLDVSRHFFGKEFVKKQIDAMVTSR